MPKTAFPQLLAISLFIKALPRVRYVDILGAAGSIPAAPTILGKGFSIFWNLCLRFSGPGTFLRHFDLLRDNGHKTISQPIGCIPSLAAIFVHDSAHDDVP